MTCLGCKKDLRICPECWRVVAVVGGRLIAHDRAFNAGSHLEWRGCKGSRKEASQAGGPADE